MDIQNISQEHMNIPFQGSSKKYKIKDSLLLVIVFLIGLIGSCYILHFALSSDNGPKGYETEITLQEHTSEVALN